MMLFLYYREATTSTNNQKDKKKEYEPVMLTLALLQCGINRETEEEKMARLLSKSGFM